MTQPTTTIRGSREIERQSAGHATSDGAGVRLTRVLTQDLQRRLDPFLLLDAFGSDDPGEYIAGFPDHPHRGFETVTYMLDGELEHRDSHGGGGVIAGGDTQWMTAGAGLVHSEMPTDRIYRAGGLFRPLARTGRGCPIQPRFAGSRLNRPAQRLAQLSVPQQADEGFPWRRYRWRRCWPQ